ncbi:MAG: hypothetical protein GQ538_05015, partial [Xanthomonadales bacterium]|nr:hypothetical protein [Xanthomonadales bacterium]
VHHYGTMVERAVGEGVTDPELILKILLFQRYAVANSGVDEVVIAFRVGELALL